MSRASSTHAATGASHVEPFLYADHPAAQSLWGDWEPAEQRVELPVHTPVVEVESLLHEARTAAYAEGREKGIEEGRCAERAALAAESIETNAHLQHALGAFESAREQIVQEFEPAVVRLALAIAARILRREAHTDPLLLSGAVRVALGQLAGSAQVRLRVPVAEETLWAEWAAMLPNVRSKLVVEAGEGMRLGDCVVETELGSADLGVRAQLGEIDRAFFEGTLEVKNA
jgi:flagellar assembly protein FliH